MKIKYFTVTLFVILIFLCSSCEVESLETLQQSTSTEIIDDTQQSDAVVVTENSTNSIASTKLSDPQTTSQKGILPNNPVPPIKITPTMSTIVVTPVEEPEIDSTYSPPSTDPEPTTTTTSATNVRITKIFYDGMVSRTEADEYVEIKNMGSETVNLAGWRLVDISEGYPSLIFPSYQLQPNQVVRVYTNQIHPEYGGFCFNSRKAVWNNSSPDTAALYNAEGKEVSKQSY